MFDGTLKFDTKIDKSGFTVGLENLGSIAKKGMAVIGAATAVAAAGIAAIGQQAVSTGKEFQSGMSQVGATLGYSVDELKNSATEAYKNMEKLTAKAEEMGAKTAFSASQAADGLNILAQSGYNADESIEMINSVLDMAAAGNLSLDAAASYVAGSMKGFTREAGKFADKAEASAYYADMIAKGATLANTNVQQLGEALSQASSTANTYGQSAQTTETALLRLAEQNEVGSAAATALAAAMKNLYSPTDQAKQALDALGVSAYDANNKTRDFNEIVDDLKTALYQIDDESQRNAIENTIFGIQGQAAFDKMISSSTEKVQSFYDSLEYTESGARGSAATQAETMLDNLAGDITIFDSAFDGFKIALFKNLDSPLRDAVQTATSYISDLTGVLKEQGLDGLASALGKKVVSAFAYISERIPKIAETGLKFTSSLGKELLSQFLKHLPDLAVTGAELVTQFAEGVADGIPEIVSSGERILTKLSDSLQKKNLRFSRLGRQLLKAVTKTLSQNTPILTEAVLNLLDFAVSLLTDSKNLSGFTNAAVSVLLALADGLISSVPVLIEKAPEIVTTLEKAVADNADLIRTSGGKILDQLGESLKSAKNTLKEHAPEIMRNLTEALENAPLAVASVADAVISAIAEAFGLSAEWQEIKNMISDQLNQIDFDDLRLKIRTSLEFLSEKAETIRKKITEKLSEIDFEEIRLKIRTSLEFFLEKAETIRQKISEKLSEIDFEELKKTIKLNLEIAVSDIPEDVQRNWEILTKTFSESFDNLKSSFSDLKETSQPVSDAFRLFLGVLGQYLASGEAGEDASDALSQKISGISAAIAICVEAFSRFIAGFINLQAALIKISSSLIEKVQDIRTAFSELKQDFETLLIDQAKKWGGDLVSNFIEGLTGKEAELGQEVGFIAGLIKSILGFSEPEKGPLSDFHTYAPDMLELFAQGIQKNIPLVTAQAENLAENLHSLLGNPVAVGVDFSEPEQFMLPEIENQEIQFEISEIPEPQIFRNETTEIPVQIQDVPEIQNPELTINSPEIPEIQNPELEINSPEIPEIQNPELAINSPEIPEIQNPELEIDSPEIPEIQNPELEIDSPEIPEIQNPELEIDSPE
ncbi:MAG: phage tail tape measure protein, partial [Oscillospiraceae bacterium]|nr:phage tail tape measure protein [Oscillospiraceae bacterium]